MRCPCRKKSETTDYADCCGRYHAGARPAPTAQALMRSRYTAFVIQNGAYLLSTWHPSTRPPHMDFTPGQTWTQLKIVSTSHDEARATVEFTARSLIGGRSHVLRETSRFVREDGRWFYVDGVVET